MILKEKESPINTENVWVDALGIENDIDWGINSTQIILF